MEDFVIRCSEKFSRTSRCGGIASFEITVQKGSNKNVKRCCNNCLKKYEKQFVAIAAIIQDWPKIHTTLSPLVNKIIYSKWHRREFKVKYIKHENMLLMCQDVRGGDRWFAVYAKEITAIK